jgi:hypothetical protein
MVISSIFRFVRKSLVIFTRNIRDFLKIRVDRMARAKSVLKYTNICHGAGRSHLLLETFSLTREWSEDSVERWGWKPC